MFRPDFDKWENAFGFLLNVLHFCQSVYLVLPLFLLCLAVATLLSPAVG